MEESIMEKEFSVKLANKPGELARVSEVLQKEGVNIRSMVTESKAEVVRIVTSDPEKSRESLKKSGMEFSERNLLVAKLEDRPGELTRISAALAKEGVNIDGAYMLDKDSKHVHMALAVSDETKARNILKL
ncbi:MAG: ACT domain-containing protein [Methanomassiliicoccus sp.]|nr:MAG: ACT domain-containing protein [Methanomassiliicoccus sp.]